MKFFDSCRYIGLKAPRRILTGVVLVLLCLGVGTALAASGEGGGGKGWVATDTYRVMNFVVLVVALILLLRKPLSQALSSRIKTIKEQLESLETQKAEAEKNWLNIMINCHSWKAKPKRSSRGIFNREMKPGQKS